MKTYQAKYFGGPNDGFEYFFYYQPPETLTLIQRFEDDTTLTHTYFHTETEPGDVMIYHYTGCKND